MAVLSPALVIAMCVMFILTRLHRHYYIFEKPFLFGLIYCLEPDRGEVEAVMRASSTSKASQPSSTQSNKSKGKKVPTRQATQAPKSKYSATSLTVRRNILNETFFSAEAEFPHHRQFDHLMAICCGYLAAYAFEEAMGCFYPNFLANKRSAYVAVFGVGFALYEAIRISIGMTSLNVMCGLGVLGGLAALSVISAGDFSNFVKFDEAFESLGEILASVFTNRLNFNSSSASMYAKRIAMMGRFLVAILAGLISASAAAPARYFSKLDFEMHYEYREDERDRRDDPYYLGRPTATTMLKVALDYAVPFLAVFFWCVSPRADGGFGQWRIVVLLACVVCRFLTLRLRLQAYLDAAIDGYRSFWTSKASLSLEEATQNTSVQVLRNSFYLMMITVLYISPAAVPFLLACVAKLDGAVRMGVCPVQPTVSGHVGDVFAREIAGFLAWWCVASYLLFAVMSVSYEFVIEVMDPNARERRMKAPPPVSSSERRKQRRIMRQNNIAGSASTS